MHPWQTVPCSCDGLYENIVPGHVVKRLFLSWFLCSLTNFRKASSCGPLICSISSVEDTCHIVAGGLLKMTEFLSIALLPIRFLLPVTVNLAIPDTTFKRQNRKGGRPLTSYLPQPKLVPFPTWSVAKEQERQEWF